MRHEGVGESGRIAAYIFNLSTPWWLFPWWLL